MAREGDHFYIVHVPYTSAPLAVFDNKADAALCVYDLREDLYRGNCLPPEITELRCGHYPLKETEKTDDGRGANG